MRACAHPAADGRPIVEPAIADELHLLDLAAGPTPDTSPALVVEVRVEGARVCVVHWLAGEPFWVVVTAGRA
jgi:hypothetical protein